MADNTQAVAGTGDTIRTVAKTANSPAKTPMSIVDIGGGADGSAETAWTGGVTQTGTWTVTATGNVASGVSDSGNPVKVGAVYNSPGPNLSSGQRVDLQADSSGRLLVNIDSNGTVTANQGGAPWSENITQFGGNAVVTGTGASGAGVPRVTVSSDSIVGVISAGDVIEIGGTTYTVNQAFANATASGETTVVAAVAAKKIRVLAYAIGPVSAAVNVFFDNATAGAICSTKYIAANSGMARAFTPFGHFTTGTVNEALRINLSGTANVGVDVLYILV